MPSKKPQVSIRLDDDEFAFLEQWAEREFMNPTQLVKIIVRRTIAEEKAKAQKPK
ncbi:hypothetical protein H6G97_27900 [Nostoc flagelliforme FACHB-838]|uniref:CopG-like ribbon-helix-helix domain-containing protein n=1 Tax=Nostoc flagelliforme FACHB-838 TaxID=2692904 RepID=A0ABR8DXR2_9NOSO|nr:hypothetical protein [Nostoc flagelliforme]MBD2533189.1 hypothetical protein [Nostoc flagelliforme FACHB-838]